ncbi:MAG: LytR/AlgR family response regulator transcription factor [Hominilimicola sp.]
MLIILVENNEVDLKNLQKYVSECYPDSDIISFANSSDALNFIQSDNFSVDLCFTAIVMPEVTGFRIATALRECNKISKVVFIADTADYAVDAWKYHVNDYLLTPITREKVEHALESCFCCSNENWIA